MLTALVAPTHTNLMDPETVLARLKLPETELAELTEQVAEASGLVARYLRYQPALGTWQETFYGINGDRLYLGARPAWAILSVNYRDGGAQATESYRLDRGPFGESAIVRAGVPWGAYPYPSVPLTSGSVIVPDWTAQYEAGWWLEEMGPTPPAGVEVLPPEIRADFLKIIRWVRASQSSAAMPGVRRMRDEGAEVEFFGADEQAVDAVTGIPHACTNALSLYRRPA